MLETIRLFLADNIRKRRKELGLTQVIAAEKSGISTPSFQKAEDPNDTSGIELETLVKIARGLGIPLSVLLADPTSRPVQVELAPLEALEVIRKALENKPPEPPSPPPEDPRILELIERLRKNPFAINAALTAARGRPGQDKPKKDPTP